LYWKREGGVLLAGCFGFPLAAQTPATVQQLESTARERLAARDANGALAAYEKLAALVPNPPLIRMKSGFCWRHKPFRRRPSLIFNAPRNWIPRWRKPGITWEWRSG
jgi:hypothetical protein